MAIWTGTWRAVCVAVVMVCVSTSAAQGETAGESATCSPGWRRSPQVFAYHKSYVKAVVGKLQKQKVVYERGDSPRPEYCYGSPVLWREDNAGSNCAGFNRSYEFPIDIEGGENKQFRACLVFKLDTPKRKSSSLLEYGVGLYASEDDVPRVSSTQSLSVFTKSEKFAAADKQTQFHICIDDVKGSGSCCGRKLYLGAAVRTVDIDGTRGFLQLRRMTDCEVGVPMQFRCTPLSAPPTVMGRRWLPGSFRGRKRFEVLAVGGNALAAIVERKTRPGERKRGKGERTREIRILTTGSDGLWTYTGTADVSKFGTCGEVRRGSSDENDFDIGVLAVNEDTMLAYCYRDNPSETLIVLEYRKGDDGKLWSSRRVETPADFPSALSSYESTYTGSTYFSDKFAALEFRSYSSSGGYGFVTEEGTSAVVYVYDREAKRWSLGDFEADFFGVLVGISGDRLLVFDTYAEPTGRPGLKLYSISSSGKLSRGPSPRLPKPDSTALFDLLADASEWKRRCVDGVRDYDTHAVDGSTVVMGSRQYSYDNGIFGAGADVYELRGDRLVKKQTLLAGPRSHSTRSSLKYVAVRGDRILLGIQEYRRFPEYSIAVRVLREQPNYESAYLFEKSASGSWTAVGRLRLGGGLSDNSRSWQRSQGFLSDDSVVTTFETVPPGERYQLSVYSFVYYMGGRNESSASA